MFYKGYHAFHEAISEARNNLGPNYSFSQNIRSVDRIVSSSSQSIQLYNYCETLAKTVKKLQFGPCATNFS